MSNIVLVLLYLTDNLILTRWVLWLPIILTWSSWGLEKGNDWSTGVLW